MTFKSLLGLGGPITLVRIPLGDDTVHMPIADIHGLKTGKTLVITAGVDGDEYAGIEAAYTLIERYRASNFSGRLIILPIVNMPGFLAETSKNPLDGVFPKYTFPGRVDGSPTERLMHYIAEHYVYEADLWLDLHSGALSETTTPLLWAYTTGAIQVDELVQKICTASGAQTVVLEPAFRGGQAATLAPKNIGYILAESGGRGERAEDTIARHVGWAEVAMHVLGMTEKESFSTPHTQTVYTHVEYISAPFNGIFRPTSPQQTVGKGDLLGTCSKFDELDTHPLTAPKGGTILYRKETMAMRKGDTLAAIAY